MSGEDWEPLQDTKSVKCLVKNEGGTKASSVAREVVNKETSYREGVVIIANR